MAPRNFLAPIGDPKPEAEGYLDFPNSTIINNIPFLSS
jgi:hypothetical protein